MKASTSGKSGVRLPLMLLLGFVVLIAGVGVWLTVSSPPPTATSKTPADKTPAAAGQKPAGKPGDTAKDVADKGGAAKDETAKADTAKAAPDTAEKAEPETAEKTDTTPPPAGEPTAQTAKVPPAAPTKGTSPPAQSTPAGTPPESPGDKAAKPVTTQSSGKTATLRPVMPKKLPAVPRDPPLSPSPDPALVQMTALGPLPRVGDDGRLPRQVYAKPFNTADRRPRVAIVVTGLGLSAAATESAIQGLPGSVTLTFAPYSPRLNEWIRLARAAGHEVLINVPMEPTNYPAYDPGPQTLLTTLNAEGNLDRLLWSLSRGTGYVGVVDFLGSQFTASKDHMIPVLRAIKQRGLLYLDSSSTPRSVSASVAAQLNMVSAKATLTLDERASRTEIDRRFAELEQRAKKERRAIGIASPYPVSLERIATWVRQLEARGVALAPVSALSRIPAPAKKAQ